MITYCFYDWTWFDSTFQVYESVSVDTCRIFLQEVIRKEDLIDQYSSFGLIYPLSRSKVHGWMIRSGAKFCRVQESYYTDSHDAALVIEYRNKF